jgi:hypothetical protein
MGMNSGLYGFMAASNLSQAYGGQWSNGGSVVKKVKSEPDESELNFTLTGGGFSARCFYCNKTGHRKAECFKFKKESKEQQDDKNRNGKRNSYGKAKAYGNDRTGKENSKNLFAIDFEEDSEAENYMVDVVTSERSQLSHRLVM